MEAAPSYTVENAACVVKALDRVVAALRSLHPREASAESREALQALIAEALSAAEQNLPPSSAPAIPQVLHLISAGLDRLIQQDAAVIVRTALQLEGISSDLSDQLRLMRHGEPDRVLLIRSLLSAGGFTRYLEIGCCGDACFSQIEAPVKVGVDPVSGGTLRLTSDQYFAAHHQIFDVIFIDGLHECRQVQRDIENALKVLAPHGYIVMHDCNPRYEIRQITPAVTGVWNGDVWKAYVHYRQDPGLDSIVADFDHGCGVLRRGTNADPVQLDRPFSDLTWNDLEANRGRWLPLRSFAQLQEWTAKGS